MIDPETEDQTTEAVDDAIPAGAEATEAAAPEAEPAPPEAPAVPHERFHRERSLRKDLEERARRLEDENKRLYETILQRLDGARDKRDDGLPPLDDDPANLARHLRLHQQAIVELGQRYQKEADRDDSAAYLRASLASATEDAPDVDPQDLIDAGGFAFRAREAMYQSYMPPEQAFKAARDEELRFIAECRKQGKNPYLAARDIAMRLGYQPRRQGHAGAAPAAPKVAQRETGGLPRGGQRDAAVDLSDPAQYDREYRRFFKERPHASKGDWYDHSRALLKKQFT